MMSPPIEDLYTFTEVADLLKVHVQTVRALVKRGELRPIPVGPKGGSQRIPAGELTRYLDQRRDS